MDDLKEVKANWAKFNVVGDYVMGTMLESMVPSAPNQWGKTPRTYVMKASEGMFHGSDGKTKVIDKDATVMKKGDTWYFTVPERMEQKMNNVKPGQYFKVMLEDIKPTNKGNPAKILKILAGGIDPEFVSASELKAF